MLRRTEFKQMETNTAKFAQSELEILSASCPDKNNRPIIEPFKDEILALCEKFGKSGQSGGSAPYTATALSQAIKTLCLQEPICPVTGIENEWMNVADYGDGKKEKECVWQNTRCSALFKRKDEKCYYLDAIIWKEEHGGCYSGRALMPNGEVVLSRQFVKSFPFKPKTFYIDVVKEILPNDWTEEPFIEWDYYNTKEYEETGKKNWITEKYRNIIKSPSQLAKAFKYYDKYQNI